TAAPWKNPAESPRRDFTIHRSVSSIGLDRGRRGISLPRWQRDHPAVVAPFRQLAEIAQHLQRLFVTKREMPEDLGGDPSQMRVIRYHMRSPGVTRPPPRCIWTRDTPASRHGKRNAAGW